MPKNKVIDGEISISTDKQLKTNIPTCSSKYRFKKAVQNMYNKSCDHLYKVHEIYLKYKIQGKLNWVLISFKLILLMKN